MKTTNVIVGCGGSGGWVAMLLAKSPNRAQLVLVDGDRIEERNLERQLFGPHDIGKNKAMAMGCQLKRMGMDVEVFREYFQSGSKAWDRLMGDDGQLRIYCCPDNHPARMACLQLADERWVDGRQTVVAISGNEEFTAQADVYLPIWKGLDHDFREKYPETVTATDGDPLHPPCTGEAVAAQPQRALANAVAAVNTAWLMELWAERITGETDELIRDMAPRTINYGKFNVNKS